eukprot:TRINITY_DN996_c0_g1_i1.p1 TRINITY_DN996_c0_g1~~TRINITY_DN996_c0_g1_i1.p1  ORF type:complete len:460 (-),score=45.47 TRINITY_DN996_c0_g1_i1:117-1337(-)
MATVTAGDGGEYTSIATKAGYNDDGNRALRLETANSSPKPFWANEWAAIVECFSNPLLVLLIFVPAGCACKFMELNQALIFGTNFIAIIPLASLLGYATESLAAHTGQLVGGLLNATFGNAVEMIMCFQAVRAGLIGVVQANLLGSILSNLLLVLGMAILGSGLRFNDVSFNAQGAAANMTCQILASISICLPTMFASMATSNDEVVTLSRICSGFLAFIYCLFLVFQLYTHADLFADEHEADDGGHDVATLSVWGSLVLLAVSTMAVAVCSESLVDSIGDVSKNYGVPKAFIGVILLPIVGNAAEHATAVTCAMKGMMDLALGVAVGSSTQVALFVVPCAVISGWFLNQPMSLCFRTFDTACQMLGVFLVSQVLQHGSTNWLHGVMLLVTYTLIAVMAYFIPDDS